MEEAGGALFSILMFMIVVAGIIKAIAWVFGLIVTLFLNFWWVPVLGIVMYLVAKTIFNAVVDAMEEAAITASVDRVENDLHIEFDQTREAMRRVAKGQRS